MIKLVFDFFYPKKCIFCGKTIENKNDFYCSKCYYKLPYIDEVRCLICGRELFSENGYKICPVCQKHKTYIEANYPSFIYEGIIKDALKRYKFAGKMWYYKQFARFIYNTIKDKNIKLDYIVYPPVNKKTFFKRGYNQAELIANELSKFMGVKTLKKCILKTHDNEKQSLMSREMRFKNVKNVFKVNEKYDEILKGKKILILDDVYTTGATINECARILKKSGAKFVYSATLCITR